jgi:hypothetical protein
MPSTYTDNLGIEKPANGEQAGTWGDTVNENSDILDEAVNGAISITLGATGSTGSPNALAITDGTSSTGRNKWIEFVDGGDLGATAYVQLTPNNAEKICFIRNSLSGSRSVIMFQGTYNASRDIEIVAGTDVVVKFDGGGTTATVVNVYNRLQVASLRASGDLDVDGTTNLDVVDIDGATQIDAAVTVGVNGTGYDVKFFGDTAGSHLLWDQSADELILAGTSSVTVGGDLDVDGTIEFDNLSGTGSVAVTDIKDEDNMASDSATAISTQQSIKAYVDSKVATADTLAEVLANGNTTSGTDIVASTDDKVQFRDSAIYINSSVDGQLDIAADGEVQITTALLDLNAASQIDGAVTVGVNGTGYDVKFFGDTAGNYMLWDQSADDLILAGSSSLIVGGDLDVDGTIDFDALSGTGSVTVTDILDEDNMASNSATALSTQQAIKAYVDSGGVSNSLNSTLTAGNTTGGRDIIASTTDKVQFRDSAIYINSSTDGQLDIIADTEVQIAATTIDVTGSLNVDGSTFKVNATNNRVGILNSSPDVTLDIGTATDAVHMPSGSTGQRPGSPAAGYFRYNTTTAGFEGYTDAWGEIGGGGANLTTNNFTGNGSTTGFTLGINPSVEQNTFVYIDGVYQQKNTYSTSGTTLTFSTAPPNGTSIEVMSMTATNSIVGTVSDNAITTAKIADGNVTLAKMAANSVDSDQYVDGSIDTVHIADSQITVAKMAANSVDSDQYVDGSIDTVHIADDQVTGAKLANNIDIAGTLDVTGLLTADASVSVTGNVDILAQGDLRLQDSAGGQYVAMQAPATIATSYTLTLPADDGDADQVLATNGSGVLDWVTSGGLYDAWSIITSATNLASGGQYISNSSSALTHTLPSGSAGSTIVIKNNGSGLVTIARTSSQKINGVAADATMPQGNAVQLVYVDGTTGWLVL